MFETQVDGKKVVSPDHYQITTPGKPTDKVTFQVNRSKGFEGMASSPDGSKLYPMLEGAIWLDDKQDYENVDGKRAARILEFDVKNKIGLAEVGYMSLKITKTPLVILILLMILTA